MKKVGRGFTLVEVSLFLAITAAVFVGVAIGTQNSMFQQRYNDTVQNYVEFLRSVYSQVANVQSENTGRSDQAIYGKLATFNKKDNKNVIKTYNVIGNIGNNTGSTSGSGVLETLAGLDANVLTIKGENSDGSNIWSSVGFVEEYTPRWEAQIQTTAGWNNGYGVFEGALLIVRSPDSGSVFTYVMQGKTIDVDSILNNGISNGKNPFKYNGGKNYLTDGSFKSAQVDFCINPNGVSKSDFRKDVRIVANARNASGVEIVPDDKSICGK